jgi:hypothetical protein
VFNKWQVRIIRVHPEQPCTLISKFLTYHLKSKHLDELGHWKSVLFGQWFCLSHQKSLSWPQLHRKAGTSIWHFTRKQTTITSACHRYWILKNMSGQQQKAAVSSWNRRYIWKSHMVHLPKSVNLFLGMCKNSAYSDLSSVLCNCSTSGRLVTIPATSEVDPQVISCLWV